MATISGMASTTAAAAGMDPADTVSVGQGSYSTVPVPGANPPPQPEEVFTTSNVGAPLPTNTWYSGEHFGNSDQYGSPSADDGEYRQYGGGFVCAQPAVVDTKNPDNPTGADGHIVYYSRDWTGEEQHQGKVHGDWSKGPGVDVSHSGTDQFADNRLDDYGDWHCRLKWGDGTATTLATTIVKGSPFVCNEFAGGGAEISFVNCANKWPDTGSEYGAKLGTSAVEAWGYTDSSEGHYFGVTVTRDGFDGADRDLATDDTAVRHFGVFAPPGSTISGIDGSGTITADTLTSDLSGSSASGVLTVAPLPSASTSLLDEYADYAYNIVRDTQVDWTYDQRTDSTVETTYSFSTEQQVTNGTKPSGTLSWLYPHQHKYTAAGTTLTDWTMWSVRGELKLHKGSQFTIAQDYPGILPQMPTGPLSGSDTDRLRSELVDVYEYPADTSSVGDAPYISNGVPSNTYFGPKDLWRNMIAYQLAEQVEDGSTVTATIVDWFVDAIEARLNNWFDATTTDFSFAGNSYSATDADGNPQEIFEYVPHLGTLLGAPMGFWARRGLTDHHFHYGYLVTVAAELARRDNESGGSWTNDYGDMVELLARDYANWERPDRSSQPTATTPKDAPQDAFPFLRNFDVYGGHSWAAGIDSGPAVNQESSSEAVNAYAAMIKWGELTGNDGMRDAGVFLYTQELHAVWEYWFDADDDSLPEQWGTEYWKANAAGTYRESYEPAITATGLSGDGYNDGLFYASSDPEQMYGIQWLPSGPQSFYLGHDRAHADRMWEHVMRVSNKGAYQNDPGEYGSDMVGGWSAQSYTFRAMSDPADAAQLFEADPNIEAVDGGNSRAWAHYITAFGVTAGAPNQNVTADTTFFQVFDDGDSGERTYVAYNAADASTTVTFSDGHSMTVAADSLGVESHDNVPKPGDPGSVTVTEKDSYSVTLDWDAPADAVWKYRVFVDGDFYGETYDPGTTVERLAAGTTYDVRVETVADSGATSNRVQPSRGTVTTDSGDTHVGTIDNLRVAGRAGDRLVLAWDQPAEPGTGLAEYTIHYRSAGASAWQTTTVSAPGRTDAPATGEIAGLSGDADYEVAVTATDSAGNTSALAPQPPLTTTTLPGSGGSTQSPYFDDAIEVPGRVEAEHWDRGGTAVAFGDSDPNVHQGAVYEGVDFRDTTEGGVDVTETPDGLGVGYMSGDEYLEYTLQFTETGTYTLRLHCAAGGSTGGRIGPLHAELDGQAITAEQDFHDTGGTDQFRTIELGTFDVTSTGQQTLRLFFSGITQVVDWFELYTGERDATPPSAPGNVAASKPTNTTADVAWDASTDDTAVAGYRVYQARAEYDRSNWTLSSSVGGRTADALDGDDGTYWWSETPRADAEITVTVDMGETNTLSRVEFDHFESADVPTAVDVETSTDGTSWTTVQSGVSPSLETAVAFDSPLDARYVRLRETDTTSADWWKITEVRAFAWDPTASGATLSWEQVTAVTDGSTTATVDGLTAGRDYLFGVSAFDRLENESQKAGATTGSLGGVDTTPPATPTGVTASADTASLTVGWSAVGEAASYNVYVNGVRERSVAAGTTEVTLWGREPDATYDVAVAAVGQNGFESGRSNTATATTGISIDYAQRAVDDDADTLLVKFTPQNETGVDAVTLNWDVNGTAQDPVSMVDPGETGTWTARLDGLDDGDQVSYFFTYERAGATRNTSNDSATFSGDGVGTVSGGNSPPTVSISGPSSASTGESVTFTASAADPDGTVAGYDWSTSDGQSGSGSSFTTSWSAAGDYDVTVTVTDDAGASASTTQTVSVTSGSSNDAVAAINAGGDAVTVDGVDYAASGTNVSGGTVSSTSDAISGGSDALYGTERYGSFTYDIPVSSGSYDVTVHLAEIYFTSSGSRVFDVTVEGTTVVDDLDLVAAVGHDTAYTATATVTPSDGTITVTASASADNPKISAITVRSADGGDTTAPAAPTNLTSSTVTSSSVDLSWDASASSDVASYAVYDGAGSQVASGLSGTSATVTGLSADTNYTFTVRAVDDAGNESDDSNAVSVTTQSDADTTAPAAPTNLTAPSKTSTSVDLSWDASTSGDVASYTVYDTNADSAVASGITGTSTTVSGLSAETQYTFAVTATDDAGNESGQSSSLTVTTAAASQAAYDAPHSIPGRVQAQNFDTGGEGTAYHDTTSGNSGGAYRTTDVDIEATGDTAGSYNVGWTAAGEWLEYTVDVGSSGTYAVSARVATPNDGVTLSVSVNGTEQISGASVPNTGGWQTWQTVDLGTVDLSAGKPTVRIEFGAGANLNWFELAATSTLETAINCGGSSFTAGDGTTFAADANYTNGTTTSTSDAISGTTDDTLYQSNRFGANMSYDVPVDDSSATYDVVLHFAEDYWTSSGARVFDVVVEGTEAVSNLDIYAEVGHDAALTRTVSGVTPTDGTVTIEFPVDADNALVSGIELIRQ